MGRVYSALSSDRAAFPMPSGWPITSEYPEFPAGTWTMASGDSWDSADGEGRWTPFGPWSGSATLSGWPTGWPKAVTPGAYTVTISASAASMTADFLTITVTIDVNSADMHWHLLQLVASGLTVKGHNDQTFDQALYAPIVEYESGKYGARLTFYVNQQNLDGFNLTAKIVSIDDAAAADTVAITPSNAGDIMLWEDGTIKFWEDGGRALMETEDGA